MGENVLYKSSYFGDANEKRGRFLFTLTLSKITPLFVSLCFVLFLLRIYYLSICVVRVSFSQCEIFFVFVYTRKWDN